VLLVEAARVVSLASLDSAQFSDTTINLDSQVVAAVVVHRQTSFG
jgi:hypothetical protein